MARKAALYKQLYTVLRSKLQDGNFQPGDLFPAESTLTKEYSVSRITVRTALDQLAADGFIERFPGKGSFVRAVEEQPRNCLTSFTDQMLSQGRTPMTKIRELKRVPAAADHPAGFPPGEDLMLIERLRFVDGKPTALVRSYLPARLVPGITVDYFEETGRGQSILYVLERHFGVVLGGGEETICPASVDAGEASLLGVPHGAAVVLKTCLVQDVAGAPVLYDEALWSAPQTQLVQRRIGSEKPLS